MANNIVALFDTRETAEAARAELVSEGFTDADIRLVAKGAQSSTARTATGTHDESFWDDVKDFFGFCHDDELSEYREGVRRGGTLLILNSDEGRVNDATNVLMRFNPVDIEKQSEQWRAEGWTGSQAQPQSRPATAAANPQSAKAPPASAAPASAQQARTGDTADQAIPVMEEQLKVGKRQVNRGIRIHQRVTERPVEEQVQLRDERVTVERRPVDRAVGANAAAGFQDRTFDVTETHEEAVVNKEARVVEEVVVSRDVKERTETVRDSVRRTDVDVEQLGQTGQTGSTTDQDYQKIYQKDFAGKGYTYDQFKPAYEYGAKLAADKQYQGRDWSAVEPAARSSFERGNPGSKWEQVKDAVRRAYDGAKAKV